MRRLSEKLRVWLRFCVEITLSSDFFKEKKKNIRIEKDGIFGFGWS